MFMLAFFAATAFCIDVGKLRMLDSEVMSKVENMILHSEQCDQSCVGVRFFFFLIMFGTTFDHLICP